MQHGRTFHQLEVDPEFIMQGIGVIAHDIETAEFERPFGSERGDDDVPARFYRQQYLPDIRRSLLGLGEELEHGTIMPNIVTILGQVGLSNVGSQPCNLVCLLTQPFFCSFDGGSRNVQHGDITKPIRQQVIHQCRRTAANVDEGSGEANRGAPDELQRLFNVRAVPADRARLFGLIDIFPI